MSTRTAGGPAGTEREERMERAGMGRIGRRNVVRGGAAASVAVALDALFGGFKPARAQTPALAPPEVDGLAVRVVVDSYQIAIAPSFKRDDVSVARFGWAPRAPPVAGGEECLSPRQGPAPPLPGNFGAIDRAALQEAKLAVVSAEAPSLVADHAFTTGQVPSTGFEKVLSPSKMTVGVSGGFGCYPEKLPEDERQAGTIPDTFRHEIATVYNLKGRGLIVLTSCS